MKKIIFFCLCVLLATGCAKQAEPVSEQPLPENPASSAEPVEGGEITVAISQDLDQSLDPLVSTSAAKREILFNVFEGLVKTDTEGNMVPALAESFEISESGDTFTFKLRKGVKFHNGKEMTAEDVLYSLNRAWGKDTGEPLVSAFSAVESIESPDPETILIHLSVPNIEFLSYLTTAILPCDYADQAVAPIGTGPFVFVSRSVQENIIMEKFADYWGEAAHLDKVTFKIIENSDALVMALRSGSVDLSTHRIASEVTEIGDEYETLVGNTNIVQALYLNQDIKPLKNLKVRQALNYAVNVREVIDLTDDGNGTPVGSSMYPAFRKYFIPELSDAYPYDPEKAKSLLAEAGYPNGFDLTITVPSNYVMHVNTAQVIAEQLKKVGINVKINLVEWATWLSQVYQGREFEATVTGFDASAMTARAMLERWCSDSPKNMINFENEEYDSVMAEAAVCPDPEKQTELYKRAETILSEEAANVYIQDPSELTVIRKGLSGYRTYPLFVMDMAALYYTK